LLGHLLIESMLSRARDALSVRNMPCTVGSAAIPREREVYLYRSRLAGTEKRQADGKSVARRPQCEHDLGRTTEKSITYHYLWPLPHRA